MKRISLILLFQLLFFSVEAQVDSLLNRYNEYLFRTHVPQPEIVKIWAETLNQQGQWADINYKDKELAGWKISDHLVRIREMAFAWTTPESSTYHDLQLKKKIDAGLDHWAEKRYQSSNWWHNMIGVPRCMRDIILLLRYDLEPDRLKQALEVLAQHQVPDDYVGGNLIWCADLGLHYGALTGDKALMEHCLRRLYAENKITSGEGIRPDYSFHQHGKRLQMYQYGKALLIESTRIAWQLRGTSWAFPEDKIDILTDFVLNGWQWMARGTNTVPGTIDRSSSRKGELRSADLRPIIPFMVALQPAKAAELMKMAVIQNGEGSLNGYSYFPYSDFAAYHRPGFSFFLKTISTRTYATESINRENLKGKLLHSGDGYLIRNGQEYFDLLPLWDWTALPGVTTFKGADLIDRKNFVGSVGDGIEGLSVMDYVIKDKADEQVLSARKFWASHQDVVISLIADLKVENINEEIYTTLDQCRWQGDVTVNQVKNVLTAGSHVIPKVKWLHHAGFAYIPLQPASFAIDLNEVNGSWTTINASETQVPLAEKIYKAKMFHHPSKAAGYALALSGTPEQAKKIAENPSWKVIKNDKDCQAVQFDNGVVMAAFYGATSLKISKQSSIQVNQPCLLMMKGGKVYASDPTHQGITVQLTVNHKLISVALPKDGMTKILSDEL